MLALKPLLCIIAAQPDANARDTQFSPQANVANISIVSTATTAVWDVAGVLEHTAKPLREVATIKLGLNWAITRPRIHLFATAILEDRSAAVKSLIDSFFLLLSFLSISL